MTSRFFVKPVPLPSGVEGQADTPRQVRKPTGGYLPQEGDTVPKDSYWLRRIADGDVVEAEAPPEPEATTAPAAAPAALSTAETGSDAGTAGRTTKRH
ncbi:MAG: DUF2635 domain-containing protein [Burkholderiales bacterium]|nr:DUF2635 domain-containing protein [Burkholderiales bacterium]